MKKVYKTITALLLVCVLVIPGSLTANASTIAFATNYATLKTALDNQASTIIIMNDITFDSTLTIKYDVTIASSGATIYALGRHFYVRNSGEITVTFQDVILEGKNGGGGIDAAVGNAVIENAIIQNCSYTYGGAIYSTGGLTLINCIINNNYSNRGGGVHATSSLTAYDCTFTNNKVIADEYGGAIYSRGAEVYLNNCDFINNYAGDGGAIYSIGTNIGLSYCTFTNNNASNGGGVYATAKLSTDHCTFTNNRAGTNCGGAIYSTSNTTISNCTLTDNVAYKGGAIYFANHGTQLTISWSTISNNSAGYGGGIFNNGTLTFDYTSITYNTAGYNGGGIFNTSSATYSSYYGAVIDNSPNNIVTN